MTGKVGALRHERGERIVEKKCICGKDIKDGDGYAVVSVLWRTDILRHPSTLRFALTHDGKSHAPEVADAFCHMVRSLLKEVP